MRDLGEGGLDRVMALNLSAVVSAGVLALLRTISLDSFGQSHRHHVGWCSSVHQERKLREKSEMRNEMREKRSEWGFSSREEAEREE